jgi:FMN reductase
MYNPSNPNRTELPRVLVEAYRVARQSFLASSRYLRSVFGLMKNALDYIEDLGSDHRVRFDGVAGARAAGGQMAVTLAFNVTFNCAGVARPTPALGVAPETSNQLFDEPGASAKAQLLSAGRQVVEFVTQRRGFP